MEIIETVKGGYVRNMLKEGKRIGGRGMMDFREIKVKAGVIEHAEGSAQADVGDTRVLAGVKLMPEDPMPDTPDQGNIITNAELLQLAYEEYEPGPPNPESVEFARVVDRGIRAASCIDLASLVLEDKKVWSVFIDLYVLNYGGNLLDAGYLAAMAALMNAKVPKYENGVADHRQRDKSLKISNIVTSTTFGKIDGSILLDMDINEERIADTRLTVVMDGNVLRAMQKGLKGSLTIQEIGKMIDTSMEKHAQLKSILENAVKEAK